MARDKSLYRKPALQNAGAEELAREGEARFFADAGVERLVSPGPGAIAAPPALGDVALVGYSTDTGTGGKGFALLLLADLGGEVIHVTDNGWLAAGGFRSGEGVLSITIPAGLPIGAVIRVTTLDGVPVVTTSTGLTLAASEYVESGDVNPSTSGDQFIVYRGTAASPTVLFAIDCADSNTTYAADATTSNNSAVPTGLTLGSNALAIAQDNGAYTGSLSGTRSQILANIANAANWTLSETVIPTYPGTFTVTLQPGTLAVNDVALAEGNGGTTNFTFTVSRTGGSDGAVSASWALTFAGTAGPDDFTTVPQSGTVNFANGETSKQFTITVQGDTTIEPNETFTVTLSAPTGGATIGDATGLGTITNDDLPPNAAPTVTITPMAIVTQGGEARANNFTGSHQQLPSVAGLSGGGYVVAWTSAHDGVSYDVYARRYDASGTVQGVETRVNTTTAAWQLALEVAGLTGGGYVVAWESQNQDGSGYGIYLQRYDASGVAQGGETLVNTFTTSDQRVPVIAGLAGGGFVIAWQSLDQDVTNTFGIYAQRYDANGVAQGAETRVNSTIAGSQYVPEIAALSGGGYVVTWNGNGPGDGDGIFAQRFDANGVAQGGETRINTTTADFQFSPSVAGLSGGGYVITWTSYNQDGSDNGVYAQRYDASGVALGGEVRVNTTIANAQAFPSVAALPGGGYVITWASTNQDGSDQGIYAQYYDASGVAQGGETRVNTTTNNEQSNPAAAGLAGGGLVIAWQSLNQDGSDYGVYAQRFGLGFAAAEQNALNLKGKIAIADADSGGADLTVTLTVDYGILTVSAGGSGATVSGSGTAMVTIVGTVAELAALLDSDATSSVTYTPDTDTPPSSATLSVVANDGGATGPDPGLSGGPNDEQGSVQVVIAISAINDGPAVNAGIADHNSNEDAAVNYQFAANAFADPDGASLTYTATLAGGGALPGWLTFNATTRTFTGTPPANFNGTLSITVTASDGSLSVPDTFDLVIAPVNDAPTAAIEPLGILEGGETRINTFTGDEQSLPSAAGLAGGGYVVTWQSLHQDGGFYGIYSQRYDANGVAQGAETRVNTTTVNYQATPSVAALSGGGYVATWAYYDQVGSVGGIYSQRYDASGVAQGGETRIDSFSVGLRDPSAAALSNGGYVVTWMSIFQDGSGSGIYAQRYNSSGVAQGSETRVNTTTAQNQESPSVAGLAGGGYVVTWTSIQDGSGYGVYAQRYNASGIAQGSETRVNTFTSGQQVAPSVVGLSGGGYVVTWASSNQDGSGYGIYAQRYDANGVAQGSETRINTTTASDQDAPALAALSSGGYVVSWTSLNQDGSGYGIYAQRYDASGVTQGPETLVNTFTANSQWLPSAAGLSGGGYLITWASLNQDGSGYGIYAQRYGSQLVATEQIALDLKGRMSVGDVDGGSGILSATLSVTYGVLNVTAGASGAIVTNSGTAGVTISGTLAQINALLSSDGTSTITYTANTDAPPASATLTLSVNDLGHSGGGPLIGSDVETIYIAAANDAPVNTVPAAQSATEDTDFVFSSANSNAISVADVDSATLTVTIGVANGTLTLSGTAGLSGLTGNGTASVSFSGTAANINAALNGLIYRGTLNFNGGDTLSIVTSDGALSDTDNVTINVDPVNDPPTLTATATNPTYTEDAAEVDLFGAVAASTVEAGQTFTSLTLTVTNVTDGLNEILSIDGSGFALSNGIGGTTANGFNVLIALSGSNATVTITHAGASAAQMEGLIDGLTYRNSSQNPTDANRVVTITQLVDSGGNTPPDDNTATLNIGSTVNVNPVNDAPSGANNITINMDEDATAAIVSTGFTDPLDGNGFAGIVVTTLPTNGELRLNGATFAAGTFVTATQLNTLRLVFHPDANENGAPYATFTFQVRDGGGTDNGGQDTDQTPSTYTINIAAVNDAPTSANLNGDSATWTENGPGVALDVGGDATVADIDSADFGGGSLTVSVTGANAFDGLFVTAGGTVTVAGNTVSVGGVQIATFTGGGFGLGNLVFTFDPDATPARIAALIGAVTYNNNGGDNPIAGTKDVTWVLYDGDGSGPGGSDSLILNSAITINAVNDAPIAVDDVLAATEDTQVTYAATDLTGNDIDPDGPALVIASVTNPTGGTASLNGDGSVTFTPFANFNGVAGFDYTVSDGSFSDTGHATVNVAAVNDAPVNSGMTGTFSGSAFFEDNGGIAAVTGISVSDVDADPATQEMVFTLQVAYGRLFIFTNVAGGITAGDIIGGANGSGMIVISATQNQINATLASNGLVYGGNAHFNGNDTLTITTNDNGNTGTDPGLTGGPGFEQDTDSKTVFVSARNDAPTVTDGTQSATPIFEDNPSAAGETVASLFNASFSDATDDQAAFGGSSANTLAGIAIVANGSSGASGAWQYFDGSAWIDIGPATQSAAVLIGAATLIRFNPALEFNGPAPTLTAHLVDSSGAAIVDGTTVDLSGPGKTGLFFRYSSGTVTLSQEVIVVNDVPMLTGLAPSAAFDEDDVNSAPQLLDADVGFADAEGDLDGGTLTVTGLLGEDVVAIRNEGTGAGEIGVDGANVTFGGTVVGSFAGGIGDTLTITFNAAATSEAIEAVIQNLTYANSSDEPTPSRNLRVTVTDPDGASTGPAFAELTGGDNPFDGTGLVGVNAGFFDLDGDRDLDMVFAVGAGFRTFRNDGDFNVTELTGGDNPFNGLASDGLGFTGLDFFDADGDGDLDALTGQAIGALKLYENNGTGSPFTDWSGANPFSGFSVSAWASPAFLDYDGDGDADLLLGSDAGTVHLFRNGTSGAPGAFAEISGAANPFSGIDVGGYSQIALADLDGDGDLDLFIGNVAGSFSAFRNNGAGTAATAMPTQFDGISFASGIVTPSLGDIDGDGGEDLIFYANGTRTFADTGTGLIAVNVTAVNDAPIVTITPPGGVTPVGSEFLVNTATLNDQQSSTIAALASGGFVVSWNDASGQGGDASGSGIKAQIFDAAGNMVGSEFLVNTETASDQAQPAIAALSSGGFVVTWADISGEGGDASGHGIKAQIFDAAGTKVGSEFLVNTVTADTQFEPTIASLASGGFVVAWSDVSHLGGDSSSTSIKAQIFDAGGTKVGGEFLVNTETASFQLEPTIAALSSGGFVAAWRDGDVGDTEIKAQIFDASGVKVGGEFVVNTETANNQQNPVIAGLASGGFVVSWSDPGGTTAQIFDATGTKVGGELLVSTTGHEATIAALASGGFVVSWRDLDEDLGDIRAQIFDAGGDRIGSEFLVNTDTLNIQLDPMIASLASGELAVTWTNDSGQGGDASGLGIKAQLFRPVFAATEQVALDLKGSLSVADVDAGPGTLTATLSVDYGVLHLDAGASGAGISNNDSASVTITGTLAQINALLSSDATSVVTFTANTDAPPASATLTLAVNDGGNTGSGGAQSGNDSATIAIAAVNDAPTVANPIPDQHSNEDAAVTYQVPANAFSDADGDTLTYSATLGDGSALPAWLTFTAGTRTFSGTPPQDFNGTVSLKVTASDGTLTGSDTFDLVIDPVNDAPTVSINAPSLPLGSEVLVNTSVVNNQQDPSVVSLSGGGYVIAWQSQQTGRIYTQRYDASGVSQGGETQVDPAGFGTGIEASIAALSGGGYVVTWSALFNDGSGFGVYARRYDASGAAQGGATLVNTNISSDQIYQSAAGLADGGYVVTWMSRHGGQYDIYVQRYSASGVAQGGETLVNTITANEQYFPAVAGLAGGGYVVAWYSNNSGHIHTQRFDASGGPQGGETQVSATNFGSPGIDATVVSVAALADGGYVATWQAFTDGSGHAINARRYDADGVALTGEMLVNTTTTDHQSHPAVTAIQDGYVVSWMSSGQDGSGYGIYAQRYDLSGSPVGGETLINTTTADEQRAPTVAALQGGGFVIIWQSNNQDSSGYGIYAQRYREDFQALEQIALDLKGTIAVADVDANSADVTVTLAVDYGIITVDPGASGVIVSDSGTSTVTLTGTLAEINNLLGANAIGAVAFTANTDNPPASAELSVTIDDGGNTGSGGALTDTETVTIAIAAINDAPVAVDDSLAATEDTPVTYAATALTGNDIDPDGPALVITSVSNATGGSAVLNMNGTVTFTPTPNFNGVAGFDYVVSDGTDSDTGHATVNVAPVNDAPIIAGGPDNVTFVEDNPGLAHPIRLDADQNTVVGDFDSVNFDGGTLTVTIISGGVAAEDILRIEPNGTVTLFGADEVRVSGVTIGTYAGGTGGNPFVVTFNASATASEVGAVMRALVYDNDSQEPTAGTRSYSIALTDGDGGTNNATGGLIDVFATNDAPSGADKTITFNEDTTYVFTAADFGFSDVDFDTLLSVRITTLPGAGQLLLNGGAMSAGQYVSALDIGNGLLTFVPAANANGAGYASLTFQVQDNGGSDNGSGAPNNGEDTDQSANTFTLDVTSVNDAPAVGLLANNFASYIEGAAAVLLDVSSNATVTDVDSPDFGGGTLTVAIFAGLVASEDQLGVQSDAEVTVGAGTITVGGNVIATFTGGGAGGGDLVFTFNTSATPAAVAQLLQAINYTNTNGINPVTAARTIRWTLIDGDGTANGGADTRVISSFAGVSAVNDAPAGTDNVLTLVEDGARTLAVADFGFSDVEGNGLLGVFITTLPANGTLTLDGAAVAAGQLVFAADIADVTGGGLVFTPAPDGNGMPYASFTFQVVDTGGTANGGQDTDQSPNTIAFNVSPVNDAAVITGDATGDVTEAGAASAGTPTDTGDLDAADVDNAADGWQAVAAGGVTANGYGTYALSASGVWTYTLNNNHAAVQALNGTATLTDTFMALTEDGTARTVTITINAQNDAAVITGDATGSVTEAGGIANGTAGTPIDTGDLNSTDVDNTNDSWTAVAAGAVTANGYGTYGLTAAGVWTYTLNDNDAAVQALNGAAALIDSFIALTADGTAQTVTITINAQNDAAVITGTIAGAVTEAGGVSNGTPGTPTATGNLDSTDPDNANDSWQAVAAGTATANGYGSYQLTAAGVWTYTLDNNDAAVQALNVGGTLTDSFNAPTADGTAQTVTVTINGANDAAVITGDSAGNVTEAGGVANGSAGTPTDTGDLNAADVDSAADAWIAVAAGAATANGYGSYALTAAGVWTYTLNDNDAAVQALNGSATLTDSFTAVTADGTSRLVTVTIGAQNDAPVVDLNGVSAGTSTTLAYTENSPVAAIAPSATVADLDTISFNGARLGVTITNGSNAEDVLSVINQGTGPGQVGYSNGAITYQGVVIASLLPPPVGFPPFLDIQFNFSGTISLAAVQAVMRAVGYQNSSDNPSITPRNVTFSLSDGGLNGLGAVAVATINLTAVDDAPVARPDAFIAVENAVLSGSVFPDNGSGADSDVDGPAPQVGAVNGSAANVGTEIALASGALLTLNANGTFSYNPNGAFNALPDFAGSGASNTTVPDSFTYTLLTGNTVTVTLTVRGADSHGDVLLGTGAADTLNGGTGIDNMTGLGGNDVYIVDHAGDQVIEAAGGGGDAVYSAVGYTLASGQEIETLSALDWASTASLNFTGNELANWLIGNAGANVLNGGGGADILQGRGGNDVYIVDHAGDQPFELAGEGNDAVYSSVSYTLASGQEIETLSALDWSSTAALSFTGNGIANWLIGNAGANVLNGGAGADILQGRGGNDIYIVDHAGDQPFELAGEGNDAVYSSVSYTLASGQEIETLSSLDWNGTASLNFTGNELANYLIGNAGANVLDGKGGNDVLVGRGGDDIYIVESSAEIVYENAGEGADAIYTSASYALNDQLEVENLSTLDWNSLAAIDLTGNALGNYMIGNAGANILDGKGGNDVLVGRGGADTFAFTTAAAAGNVDLVADFQQGIDKLALDDAVFAGIGSAGSFNANAFVTGSAAQDADDRIVYNSATGQLFYDADGNGAGAAVLFATLSGAPTLTASDFQVI